MVASTISQKLDRSVISLKASPISVTDEPLVSVVIPAYNGERFIERTLMAVLSQTYKNIEVIVVDDESQDRTAEIVKAIARQDKRVFLLQQKNQGVAAARNLAIRHSTGEFIAPIDADDLWYPQHLAKQVQCFLKSNSSVGVIYSWSADIDESDALTGGFRTSDIEGEVYQTLICHNFIGNSSATLIARNCIERVGAYDTDLKKQNAQGCEDWDLYLRIAEYYEFRAVTEFTVGYRQLESSMSCDYSQMAKSHALMLQGVKEKHPEISSLLYRLSSSSFYMYLARQSSGRGDDRATLFWLKQAALIDWLTPFFRFGFYSLSIKSLVGLTRRQFFKDSPPKSAPQSQSKVLTGVADLEKKRSAIQFRLLVGRVFHQLLTNI